MLFAILFMLSIKQNLAEVNIDMLHEKFKKVNIENYTSCEEFIANYTFDPNSVVNVDWKIFYFWSHLHEESYNIKFSLATNVLVDRFRVELDSSIHPPVNWTNAVLFMETSIDFSALFISTNVSGIFRIIPTLAFEYNEVPMLIFALKVVEPGYLGIHNCKNRLCYVLAPVDKMPDHDHMEEEARKIGFWNDFGYVYSSDIFSTLAPPYDPVQMDDDEEDENVELIHNENMEFF